MKINFMGVTLTDDVMMQLETLQGDKDYLCMLNDGLTALNDIVLEHYEQTFRPAPMEAMDHLLLIRDLRQVLRTLTRPTAGDATSSDLDATLDDEADLTAYLQSADHNRQQSTTLSLEAQN